MATADHVVQDKSAERAEIAKHFDELRRKDAERRAALPRIRAEGVDALQRLLKVALGMITADIVMMNYELRRAAANDDRMPVVSATVKINTTRSSFSLGAIGRSIDAIRASAEQLAGDEPFGLSVMVRK